MEMTANDAPDRPVEPPPRGWLLRGANIRGQNLVPDWLAEGYGSVAAPELGKLEPGLTRSQIAERIGEAYAHRSFSSRMELVTTLHTFYNLMKSGDVLVTVDGDTVHVGRIQGDALYDPEIDPLRRHRRPVRWSDRAIRREDLSSSAQGALRNPRLLAEVLDVAELMRLAFPPESQPATLAPPPQKLSLPAVTQELADELFLEKAWLQEILELLEERKQVIFYGPPGTGKTWVARALGRHVAEDNVSLVQFHPAYSYEDFFEGFRPSLRDDGVSLGFRLTPGPFRRLVSRAQEPNGQDQPHVLIIDEINRANLARVFGELYFLLDYRNQPIELMYSQPEESSGFQLPENIFIIGTMNTVDRSVAAMDLAMRRRFAFRLFLPQEYPLNEVLRKYLKKYNLPLDAADLLDELNRQIGQDDFAVGPSFLMRKSVADERKLKLIWESEILPLLEGRFAGQRGDVRQQFSLKALREELKQRAADRADRT
jgi:5-methylcytosine-specific restriction protein B